jgi:hypothetical protein
MFVYNSPRHVELDIVYRFYIPCIATNTLEWHPPSVGSYPNKMDDLPVETKHKHIEKDFAAYLQLYTVGPT